MLISTTSPASALPGCSAVIVNYRTPDLVIECVRSIERYAIVPVGMIYVVDNGSDDGSVERIAAECPDVHLLRTENNGFGHGVNFGVRATNSELVLVLNPDTEFVDRSIEKVAALMAEDVTIGIAGLDLRNPDGTRQYSARTAYDMLDILIRRTPLKKMWPFSVRNERHLMTDRWTGRTFDADWVMGTGFVIRREAFDQVSGMDTDFFLYMEDVDLCLRMRKANRRVVAVVDSILIHHHQRASADAPLSKTGRMHMQSLLHFIRKNGMAPL